MRKVLSYFFPNDGKLLNLCGNLKKKYQSPKFLVISLKITYDKYLAKKKTSKLNKSGKLVTMPSLSFQTCWFLWTIRGLKHNGHFLLLLADEIPPESAEELFSCFWMWLWKAAAFLKYLIVWNGQPEAQHL